MRSLSAAPPVAHALLEVSIVSTDTCVTCAPNGPPAVNPRDYPLNCYSGWPHSPCRHLLRTGSKARSDPGHFRRATAKSRRARAPFHTVDPSDAPPCAAAPAPLVFWTPVATRRGDSAKRLDFSGPPVRLRSDDLGDSSTHAAASPNPRATALVSCAPERSKPGC